MYSQFVHNKISESMCQCLQCEQIGRPSDAWVTKPLAPLQRWVATSTPHIRFVNTFLLLLKSCQGAGKSKFITVHSGSGQLSNYPGVNTPAMWGAPGSRTRRWLHHTCSRSSFLEQCAAGPKFLMARWAAITDPEILSLVHHHPVNWAGWVMGP